MATILEQKVFLKGIQRFEILPDGNLDITYKRFSVYRQFRVPLSQIIPNPERIKTRQVGTIVGAVIFGLMTLAVLIGMVLAPDIGTVFVLLWPATLLGILFAACLWKLQSEAVDGVSFHFRTGGQMHLWFNKPDAATFQEFCETLTQKINEARQTPHANN